MSFSKTESESIQIEDTLAKNVRKHIGWLIVGSCVTVALAFGLSFYFGLVSSSSAVSTQFPELLPVVNKLKNLLISNTVVFVLIIIASFFLLSVLVPKRIFGPLTSIQRGMISISRNKLPDITAVSEHGAFEALERSFINLVTTLRDRDLDDNKKLGNCLESISSIQGLDETKKIIELMIAERQSRTGSNEIASQKNNEPTGKGDRPVFMQPM